MNALPAAATQYRWLKRPAPGRSYELRSGAELLGVLAFASRCGSLARAETAHGSWTLKRQGFLSPRVTVRDAGSEVTKGIFEPSWTGGGEFVYGGARYRFSGHGWFHPTWTATRNGEPVLHTESKDHETRVNIDCSTPLEPELLSLLLALAVYVPVLAKEDAETAAVTAAIIS